MATQIQLRRDTASNWTSNNPTLAAGEFGWEQDTNKFKIGTGSEAWNSLGYASDGDTAGITFVGDDSTGTLVKQNETFKIAGTQNITAVVSGDTLTLTGPDLSSYLTSVSESDVTQHQSALSITESQISDLSHFSGAYADLTGKPTIPTNNTELTNGAGYITASSTDTLTNKSGNVSQFTNDSGYKTSVSEADVTQHQSALSVTESQISDLGTYLTTEGNDLTSAVTWANVPNANITESSVTQHQAALSITESQISDLSHFSGSYTDLTNKPTIPTNNTELTNGAGYATTSYVDSEVAGIVDTAPEALNTLNELAAALGDDANFATTTSTALGNRLRVDTNAQGLTATQKTNAKTNLGLSTVATSGAYGDLSGLPTIPTNNNELTNGAGYITDYTVTEGDVTAHQAALSITESQISDLSHFSGSYTDLTNKPTIPTNNNELTNGAGYITASSTDTLTNKSGNVSQFTNDSGYKTAVSESDVTQHQAALSITESQISDLAHFSGSYTDLTNKPTIPTNNTELTNGAGYITASSTDTLTNKSGNISQFTNDSGYKTSVSQSDVTQHQSALSITESQISDLSHFSGSYTDLTNKPTIPTNNNELTNGAGYITASSLTGLASESYVNTQISNTVDSAPETLNTLNELAAALGDDANFATTTSTALGNRLRVDTAAQGLTSTQKSNAKTNLGLSAVASTGAYSDLTGTPTIPTNNNELTNGAGYITDYTVTQGDVTAHQAALSITESQITDLGSYITASSTDTLTNKSGNISQWTNDSGYSTFSGSYTDLTNKPTIPTNNNQLTNGAGYLTSVAFADVTSKPTTIAGYGITDAFDGAYSSLSGTPTIPSALTDLSITDGSNGQVLTTDGAGNFTFTTVSGGGTSLPSQTGESGKYLTTDGTNLSWATVSGGSASTGDFTFTGNEMSTSSSNADMELGTSGTGSIVLKANGGSTSNLNFTSGNRFDNANILYYEDLNHTPGSKRIYGNTAQLRLKLDGTDTGSGDARLRAFQAGVDMDINGSQLTNTGSSRGPVGVAGGMDITNTSTDTGLLGSLSSISGYNYFYDYGGSAGDIDITNAYGFRLYSPAEFDGLDGTVTNAYGSYIGSPVAYGSTNLTVTNSYGYYYNHNGNNATFTNTPYSFYSSGDEVRNRPGGMEKFSEYSYNTTHSSGSTYTIDWNNGNLQTVTLTSNITGFTMSNFPTNEKFSVGLTLYLVQDGTGSRSMTFSAASGETFKFSNGSNTSSVSSANDIQVCYIFSRYDGTNNTFYWTLGPAFS